MNTGRCYRHRGCSSNPLFRASQPQVPELTRIAGIQLNERVSLRCDEDCLPSSHRTIPQTSGPTSAKPSGVIFRLAALFSCEEQDVNMLWFLAFPIICLALAAFMWRFERHLHKLTGPWISD
jgi:hypothetical protein